MTVQVKRVYEQATKQDGVRVLVDRLWPRGLTKEQAHIDKWMKDIAPSSQLRQWYDHDPAKWTEFKKRYFKELEARKPTIKSLCEETLENTLTLVYSSRQKDYNNATALKEFMETMGFQ